MGKETTLTEIKQQNGKKAPQYIAGLTAALASLVSGTILAWMSQISEEILNGGLGFPVTSDELGWAGSLMPCGAAFLCLFTGIPCDYIGRKLTMLALIVPATAGWSLLLWANSVTMLYFGRFITGMVAGAYCVAVSLYANEISQKELRGALGCYLQLMMSAGILLSTILSKYLSVTHFTITSAVIPFIFGGLFAFMPETPVYWIKKNQIEKARAALVRLRGSAYDSEQEIREIQGRVKEEQQNSVWRSVKESFNRKAARKAYVIGFGLMFFKVVCGIDPITTYASYIFDNAGVNLDPKISTIIMCCVQLAAGVIQTLIVDRVGRRILLLLSDGIMVICLVLVGLTQLLNDRDLVSPEVSAGMSFVPLVALYVFISVFAIGMGPVPWMMCAEIFPQEVKSVAVSFGAFESWLTAFAVTKCFLLVQVSWGGDVAFFILAGLSAIGTVFVYILVPETKEKTFEEIQELLER